MVAARLAPCAGDRGGGRVTAAIPSKAILISGLSPDGGCDRAPSLSFRVGNLTVLGITLSMIIKSFYICFGFEKGDWFAE